MEHKNMVSTDGNCYQYCSQPEKERLIPDDSIEAPKFELLTEGYHGFCLWGWLKNKAREVYNALS